MRTLLVLGCFATLSAIVASGCGGDESALSETEYFERMRTIGQEIEKASAPVFAALSPLEDDPGDVEALGDLADAIEALDDVIGDAESEVSDLRAPSAIAAEHASFASSFAETRGRFRALTTAARRAESADELWAPLDDAFGRHAADPACHALVARASELGARLDLGCGPPDGGSAPRRSPPPALVVQRNQLMNELGEVVVLRGVAVADPAFSAMRPRGTPLGRADMEILAADWNVDIIRVPIHPPAWSRTPDYAERYLDPIVSWAGEFGFYVLLGWHAHGNPITGEVEQPSSGAVPNERNPYNPDLELAKAALAQLAERYGARAWVLYGTFNEPSHIEWREWRPVAEELVDVIHVVAPDAVVFVSGVDWGYDLSGALSDPVRRPNVVYESHPYPGKGDRWKAVLDRLRESVPVFLGEWGFSPESDDSNLRGNAKDYGIPLIEYTHERGIGWIAWWWDDSGDVALLSAWETHEPTKYGRFVKAALNAD